jgi:hypothetical protein
MKIADDIMQKVLHETKADAQNCKHTCYQFEVLYSPYDLSAIYVRYVRSDTSNPDNPEESYRWLCFNDQGERVACDPEFDSLSEENHFKNTMVQVQTIPYFSDL